MTFEKSAADKKAFIHSVISQAITQAEAKKRGLVSITIHVRPKTYKNAVFLKAAFDQFNSDPARKAAIVKTKFKNVNMMEVYALPYKETP